MARRSWFAAGSQTATATEWSGGRSKETKVVKKEDNDQMRQASDRVIRPGHYMMSERP